MRASRVPVIESLLAPWRSRVVLLLAVLGLAAVSLSACAAPRLVASASGQAAPDTSSAPAASRSASSVSGRSIYVAVEAVEAGRPAAWLKGSPIRLWFERLNGVRTAIVDAPVNTYNVPTTPDVGALWSGKDTAVSAVGCGRGCEADGFVGRLTSAPARASEAGGFLTITAGHESIRFAPTRAPVPERSGCHLTSIDAFPCRKFVSVSGTQGPAVLDSLRTTPVTATIAGTGQRRQITIHDGPETLTAPIRVERGIPVTSAGTVTTSPTCSKKAVRCGHAAFLELFFAAPVAYKVHASSLLVTSGDRTLQLEAR